MRWTTSIPSKFGYYWWKIIPEIQPEVVMAFEDGTFFKCGDDHQYSCLEEGGEWTEIITVEEPK